MKKSPCSAWIILKAITFYTANVLQQFQKIWKRILLYAYRRTLSSGTDSGSSYFSYGNALYSLCPDIDEKQLTKITNFIHGELKKNHVLMSAAISSHSENLSEIPLLRSQTVEIFNTLKNSSHFVMLYRGLENNPVASCMKTNYFQVLLNSLVFR